MQLIRSRRLLWTAGVGLALSACSDSGGTAGPDEFLGPTFHLEVGGFIDGQTIDIHLDETLAGDAAVAWCQREYWVPDPDDPSTYGEGAMDEIELTAFVQIGGEDRRIQLELKQHDFASDPEGTEVTVVPRSDILDPAPDEMWIEFEIEDLEANRLFEQSAVTGTFVVGPVTGTPGPDGVVIPAGEGEVGGWLDARWSTSEELRASFYVRCTSIDIDPP
jgi:hypothetical protein